MKPVAEDLADARPRPVWWEGRDDTPVSDPLHGEIRADLVVIGAGLTGLWAAVQAIEENPGRTVVLLEGRHVGAGASGRNGGFVSASLTHGLAHGAATWPHELPTLLRLGQENLLEIEEWLAKEKVEAGLRLCGKTTVATRAHEVAALKQVHALHERFGETTTYLTGDEVRADVHSRPIWRDSRPPPVVSWIRWL